MNQNWIEQIRHTLEPKSTPELLQIWTENDHEQYTAEAFIAVGEILEARGVTLPPQGLPPTGGELPAVDSPEPGQTSALTEPASSQTGEATLDEAALFEAKITSGSGVSAKPAQPAAIGRPGCVTVFALLLGIGGAFYTLSALLGLYYASGDTGAYIEVIITLALAALFIAVAVGLWRLKNWARIAVMVLQALGMLILIFLMFSGVFSLPAVIGLAVGAYTIYWFAANGAVFKLGAQHT